MDGSGLGYCILGIAGKLLEALKKKKKFLRQNWNGYCQVPTLRSRHRFEVATWVSLESVETWNFEVATGLEALRGGLMSRHHFEVATWVATKEVATWKDGVTT